jgi:hypothetical protein
MESQTITRKEYTALEEIRQELVKERRKTSDERVAEIKKKRKLLSRLRR